MTTAAPSTVLATIQPAFTDAERLALAGFPAGYRGLTREAYALDLRQFTSWCRARSLNLFAVRRADIENFARYLEARGRARATVPRRVCTIAGFYKYAVEEELLEHSPAAHVRRPRVGYESHAVALDRNELGALLVAAGLGPPAEHALISLLALNGLRFSEATGADIEQLGLERGHRTLTITRKGGKVVTIPLAPAGLGPVVVASFPVDADASWGAFGRVGGGVAELVDGEVFGADGRPHLGAVRAEVVGGAQDARGRERAVGGDADGGHGGQLACRCRPRKSRASSILAAVMTCPVPGRTAISPWVSCR